MKVSIICTNYNKEKWIAEAIDSFLSQTAEFDFEIIIVDDASTDSSRQIIKDYAKKYPQKIRAFFNQKNKGITKTWIAICQEAKGEYIARCDGDDYWLDDKKLQKQVDLLEANTSSKWSNSDFDIVDSNGVVTHTAAFENGVIGKTTSYESMLANRGFTMASTWLVETQLMLDVNKKIDPETLDDTFNIQLELFQATELTYLPEVTTVYRLNQGSDSHPSDYDKLQTRFYNLLETQLNYLHQYPEMDYIEFCDYLLKRNTDFELLINKLQYFSDSDKNQPNEFISIYLASENEEFSQENVVMYELKSEDTIELVLSPEISRIRVDLTESANIFTNVKLVDEKYKTDVYPQETNAFVVDDTYIFPSEDQQITYYIRKSDDEKKYIFHYKFSNIGIDSNEKNFLEQLCNKIITLSIENEIAFRNQIDLKREKQKCEDLQVKLFEATEKYNKVISSRRWTIPTKIINFIRRQK